MQRVDCLKIENCGYVSTVFIDPETVNLGMKLLVGKGAYLLKYSTKPRDPGDYVNLLASLISGVDEVYGDAYLFAVDYDGELTRDIGNWRG